MYLYKIYPTTKMMEPMKQQKKKFGFNENLCLCIELHDAKSEQNIHRYKTNIYDINTGLIWSCIQNDYRQTRALTKTVQSTCQVESEEKFCDLYQYANQYAEII